MHSQVKKYADNLVLMLPIILMVALIVFMLLTGTLVAFKAAFVQEQKLSLDHLSKLFFKKQFASSFGFTFFISLASTVLTLVVGVLISHLLSRSKHKHNAIIRVITVLPYIAAVSIFVNAFGEGGFIWYLLNSGGYNNINIVSHKSAIGIILLFLYKITPYLIISFIPIFTSVNSKYYDTAHNLGCTKIGYFRLVLIPACKRSILSNFILIFNFIMFSFEPFQFLGPTIPKGLGVLANEWYRSANLEDKRLGMTLNFFMMFLGCIGSVIYIKLLFRSDEDA